MYISSRKYDVTSVNYVIDPKLEMNTIIFLNVIILTKNVSSHCQIISYIDIILLNFLNLCQVEENYYWRNSDKTNRHDITELLLKVVLNTIKPNWNECNYSVVYLGKLFK
jgi:hypothetical protein